MTDNASTDFLVHDLEGYSCLEEEVLTSRQLAKEICNLISFPLQSLPNGFALAPLELRNKCTSDRNISVQKITANRDKDFVQSVKNNVTQQNSFQNATPYQISALLSEMNEDDSDKAKNDDKLQPSGNRQRQEFFVRIFILLDLFSPDQNQSKDQRFWKRSVFMDQLLKWVEPLAVCLDSPNSSSPTHFFESFLLLIPPLYTGNKKLKPIFKVLLNEFEIDLPDALLSKKIEVKKPIVTRVPVKRDNQRKRDRRSALLAGNRTQEKLRLTSGSFYHTSSLMNKQFVVKKKRTIHKSKRNIERDVLAEPTRKRRKLD